MRSLQSSRRQVVVAGGSGAGWILPMLSACIRQNDFADKAEKNTKRHSMRVVLATREAATCHWFDQTVRDLLAEHGRDRLPSYIEVELHYTGSGNPDLLDKEVSDRANHSIDIEKAPEKTREVSMHGSDSGASARSSEGRCVHHSGRPDLPAIVRAESAMADDDQLGVFVCGPLSMQNDVSNAVAAAQIPAIKGASRSIYLHMEHFSWA